MPGQYGRGLSRLDGLGAHGMNTTLRLGHAGIAASLLALLAAEPASAHPHVWVAVEATVAYQDGSVRGLQQRWTFDDMYTAMAVQGLDKNGDGAYDRAELAELAKVNIDGIKQFEYFTHAKLGDGGLKFAEPTDYWLEYKDNVLTLNFLLPLEQPLAAATPGFSFAIYDPTYFIAFDFAKDKDKPVRLGDGAPAGCALDLDTAANDADTQSLADAFSAEMGGFNGSALARTARVNCAKS
jgi:ABC-type uncharacterized transport system substrate-binding protein